MSTLRTGDVIVHDVRHEGRAARVTYLIVVSSPPASPSAFANWYLEWIQHGDRPGPAQHFDATMFRNMSFVYTGSASAAFFARRGET